MNVTYVCNNRCTFCAVGTRTQVDGHPTRQREHLDRYRAQGVTMVDFDGGEPTLNPELIPLVRYARSAGYERVNVTTNGRLCAYEKFARSLVRSGLTTLLFSVHGHDAQVARPAGGRGGGLRADRAGHPVLREARAAGRRARDEHHPHQGQHLHLEAVTQLAWDLGLRWLNIQFLTPFGRATKWISPDTQTAATSPWA
jgi:MoaA/NifB/PqqE/SkfB family radical SAM enzyme